MMQRRNFLKLLATAAALPAVAPLVEALAPLVRVAPKVNPTAYGVLTMQMLEDAVRHFGAGGDYAPIICGPKPLLDAYEKLLAADQRRWIVVRGSGDA
jgi:hypothetical protein